MSTPPSSTTPTSAVPLRLVAVAAALVVVIAVVLGIVAFGGDDGSGTGAAPTTTSSPSSAPSSSTSPSGPPSALAAVDATFPGLVVDDALTRNHANRGERVAYPDAGAHPPLGGNHAAIWMSCQAYDAPVPNENAVHSLEHGAVWITYRPDVAPSVVSALRDLTRDRDKVLVSPYSQDEAVVLTAWGRQLRLATPDQELTERFVDAYADGPQNPEPGATCQSPVDQPGTAPWVQDPLSGGFVPSTSTETVPADGPIS